MAGYDSRFPIGSVGVMLGEDAYTPPAGVVLREVADLDTLSCTELPDCIVALGKNKSGSYFMETAGRLPRSGGGYDYFYESSQDSGTDPLLRFSATLPQKVRDYYRLSLGAFGVFYRECFPAEVLPLFNRCFNTSVSHAMSAEDFPTIRAHVKAANSGNQADYGTRYFNTHSSTSAQVWFGVTNTTKYYKLAVPTYVSDTEVMNALALSQDCAEFLRILKLSPVAGITSLPDAILSRFNDLVAVDYLLHINNINLAINATQDVSLLLSVLRRMLTNILKVPSLVQSPAYVNATISGEHTYSRTIAMPLAVALQRTYLQSLSTATVWLQAKIDELASVQAGYEQLQDTSKYPRSLPGMSVDWMFDSDASLVKNESVYKNRVTGQTMTMTEWIAALSIPSSDPNKPPTPPAIKPPQVVIDSESVRRARDTIARETLTITAGSLGLTPGEIAAAGGGKSSMTGLIVAAVAAAALLTQVK